MSASLIERAYELASSGRCGTLTDVKDALRSEGFSRGLIEESLNGKLTRSQIAEIIAMARASSANPEGLPDG